MDKRPLWARMDAASRQGTGAVAGAEVPAEPGVFALYRNGAAVFLGRAPADGGLRERVYDRHLATGPDLTASAFRRNVATRLKVADVEEVRSRPLTKAEVSRVNRWVAGCDVAWLTCADDDEATTLEHQLKAEFRPPLTKR